MSHQQCRSPCDFASDDFIIIMMMVMTKRMKTLQIHKNCTVQVTLNEMHMPSGQRETIESCKWQPVKNAINVFEHTSIRC